MKNTFIICLSLSIILMSQSCADLFKKDLSLTKKEYKRLGMPDNAKTWSKEEYGLALSALKNIKLYNPLALPRKYSRRSGNIFKHLLSEENISFLQDSTLSLADKAFNVQYFSSFQKGLIFLYTVGIKDTNYYNKELIDIYIFGLFVYKNMLELAEKISNSDDIISVELNPGRSLVSKSYLELIFTIMEEQIKSDKYEHKDLIRLSDEVSQSLSDNWKWIESPDREKIKNRIQGVIETSPSDAVRNKYQKILDRIRL